MSLVARPVILNPDTAVPETTAMPVGADAFAASMSRLGPFESNPQLAVAVSGGRDSMALVLLAAEWAAARGGLVTAVTLDHGLRETSAAEAALVSTWMARHGIPHHTLAWLGTPGPGLPGMGASEAAARSARYGLLEAFCRDHGILHLLVGHHHADQAETREMRRDRSSGPFGLAGMSAVRELPHARILRPFLGIARARLTATLHARRQSWIEDPSNQDMRFARARMRAGAPNMASAGPDEGADLARMRVAAEREIARIAVRAVAVHPAGFATLDPALLGAVDREAGVRLIGSLVTCIGGRVYAPRGARLNRLADTVIDGSLGGGATLGGCAVQPCGNGLVRIARELAAIDQPRQVTGDGDGIHATDWDGRFQVSLSPGDKPGPGSPTDDPAQLGAVGHFTARGVLADPDSPRYEALPHAVRMTLPAIFHAGQFQVCALPFSRDAGRVTAKARFAPKIPVVGAVFATG